MTGAANGTADPRDVGELFNAWLLVKMGEVDDLVAEAKDKVAAIPSWRLLVDLVGELVIRQAALEREVAELKEARLGARQR
jgi:hypothetical protein